MERTLSVSDDVIHSLQKLFKQKPLTLMEGEKVKGIVVDATRYHTLVELLENIEDLKIAEKGETEYRTGKGRPFARYDAERKTRNK